MNGYKIAKIIGDIIMALIVIFFLVTCTGYIVITSFPCVGIEPGTKGCPIEEMKR